MTIPINNVKNRPNEGCEDAGVGVVELGARRELDPITERCPRPGMRGQ